MGLCGLTCFMVDGINLLPFQTMQAKKIFCVSARKVWLSTTSLKPQTNNNTIHRSLSIVAERGCDWAGRWIVLLSCKSIKHEA